MATNPKMRPCPKCGLTDFLEVYDYDGARYVECNNGFNSTPTPPAVEPCHYRSYPAATSTRYAIKFHNESARARERQMREIVCTAEQPWDRKRQPDVRVVHPDAVEGDQRDGYPGGDYVDYECPHCKHQFSVELPQ